VVNCLLNTNLVSSVVRGVYKKTNIFSSQPSLSPGRVLLPILYFASFTLLITSVVSFLFFAWNEQTSIGGANAVTESEQIDQKWL
jgi:hypothetical protein